MECLTPECGMKYAKSYEGEIEVNCQKCDRSWCLSCKTSPYHRDCTCEENLLNNPEKQEERKMIEDFELK